jgi:8-oxo-dGTP pyrophosphatase MutT (NUDIX family)
MEFTVDQINNVFCNNCGKQGHSFHQCKIPITSIGVVIYRINNNRIEYLMIRRKDTLGYVDFMRGKYSVHNKYYIMNMLKQMTIDEKEKLKKGDFNELWENIWGENSVLNKYKTEESVSKEKFQNLFTGILVKDEYYTLNSLIDESNTSEEDKWIEPEWGFPKGRRNFLEKDYDCAIRECCEETGFKSQYLRNTQNILPFEEIFTGSNYKSYKHKYYLMFIDYANSLNIQDFQKTEVSKMEWKSLEEALESIRYYNVEKKRILIKIDKMLKKYKMMRM